MIDKRPALVVTLPSTWPTCRHALAFGRANGLDIAVRGAGHSGAGFGTVDGGLVIDLSPHALGAASIRDARTAQVGGGAHARRRRPRDASRSVSQRRSGSSPRPASAAHARAAASATSSRKHGLSIDNIASASTSSSPTAASCARARTRTRISSGRSAAAAATSASSPRSPFEAASGCRRSSPDRCSGRSTRRPRCSRCVPRVPARHSA